MFAFSIKHYSAVKWAAATRPQIAVCCKLCDVYLFSYKPEALIRSVTLIRLPQDRVKGFASCSMVGGGICSYCKRSNIHLCKKKSERMDEYKPCVTRQELWDLNWNISTQSIDMCVCKHFVFMWIWDCKCRIVKVLLCLWMCDATMQFRQNLGHDTIFLFSCKMVHPTREYIPQNYRL